MVDENDAENSRKEQEEKDKIGEYIAKAIEGKKKAVAKDLVQLSHVEVKKQELSKDTLNLAQTLRDQLVQHDQFEILSNDEITILESFDGKRLFLTRIAIVVNQSRVPLGIEPFKKAELEKLLNSLISKGYIKSEKVGDNEVYFLTERGNYRVQ
jgi:predicted transcriptional regulator